MEFIKSLKTTIMKTIFQAKLDKWLQEIAID